jgi:histidinol-phosphate aminotransferase
MPEPAGNNLRPASRIGGCEPYTSPAPPCPIDLWLSSNEGLAPPPALLDEVQVRFCELARRYPSTVELEALLAKRFGLSPEQVLVTAGADDALYRACLAMLDRGNEMILPTPTFEMLDRYGRLAGAEVIEVDWLSGVYPAEAVIADVTDRTAMIAVVSPNNPTGAVAGAEDLRRLSAAAPGALLLVDLAYTEFAGEDLTQAALALPNALVVRSFSKVWGLAGLRVGYALGSPAVVRWLRAAGNPYAVSGLSAALAYERLRTGSGALSEFIAAIRRERAELHDVLLEVGAEPLPSEANFVLARFAQAAATWDALARLGIAVRAFPGHPRLRDYLRITCPGDSTAFAHLLAALRKVGRVRSSEPRP